MNSNKQETLIEKTLEQSGTKHKYQYIMLILTLLIWINIDLVSISFPFIEKEPEVNYIDPISGENITTQLNYTICDDPLIHYTKTKVYGHSWISMFDIECNPFKISLIGISVFLGGVIGSFLFPVLADYCHFDIFPI